MYELTAREIAAGYLPGLVARPRPTAAAATPRRALEDSLLAALRRPPCVIAFSGGRDSSALLALALHVARKHGLADPLPVTRIFPKDASTDEAKWQRLV